MEGSPPSLVAVSESGLEQQTNLPSEAVPYFCLLIDNRDASLPSLVPRRVAVLLVLLWAFLRLCRTHRALRVSKERRWSGSVSLHRACSGH